ncbi:MAG: transcriptional regulator [Chloroflexota bacterium]
MKALDHTVRADFERVRRKAFWRDVLANLRGQPNQLIAYDDLKEHLRLSGQAYRGVKAVAMDRIVGSVGRFRDFDRVFLPKQTHTRERWQSVDMAHHQGIELPPIKVYQVGEVFFVRDGNHRVSVAREQGCQFIDAEVVELTSRVPVTADLTPGSLIILGEQADFMEATGLNELRPEARLSFSEAGHYRTLVEHITVHRHFLGQEQQREVPWPEAVTHWHDEVYQPVVQIIRQRAILHEFPRRTETDLYLWIMDHLYFLRQQYGQVDVPAAIEAFAETHSQRPLKRLVRGLKQAVEEIIEDTTANGNDPEQPADNPEKGRS